MVQIKGCSQPWMLSHHTRGNSGSGLRRLEMEMDSKCVVQLGSRVMDDDDGHSFGPLSFVKAARVFISI